MAVSEVTYLSVAFKKFSMKRRTQGKRRKNEEPRQENEESRERCKVNQRSSEIKMIV